MTSYLQALSHRAITAALTLRADYGQPLDEPICVFDLAKDLGLRVQFDTLETQDFEGIYAPSINQITLEPRRPSLRQRFTCAHELGHHIFRHGQIPNCTSSDGSVTHTNTRQEEFLANVFAAFLLMPKAAVFTAFRRHGVEIHDAGARDFYIIACRLGVGYSTLIKHMATYLGGRLPRGQAELLLKQSRALKAIRANIIDEAIPAGQLGNVAIYSVIRAWKRPVDMVARELDGDIVKFDFEIYDPPPALKNVGARCYRAIKEGTHPLRGDGWEGTLRCYDPLKGGWWKVRIAGDD